MPPDVFLALASSGITLVASYMYLIQDPKREAEGPEVSFCGPPQQLPPPLPSHKVQIQVSTQTHLAMDFSGGEWTMTYTTTPFKDAVATSIGDSTVQVNDLRWHSQAGVSAERVERVKIKPFDA
jgi:hypothetical protein